MVVIINNITYKKAIERVTDMEFLARQMIKEAFKRVDYEDSPSRIIHSYNIKRNKKMYQIDIGVTVAVYDGLDTYALFYYVECAELKLDLEYAWLYTKTQSINELVQLLEGLYTKVTSKEHKKEMRELFKESVY